MEWILEFAQSMVMLLLDFKKVYDRIEWGFLGGTMSTMGFDSTLIKWIRSLFVDSWYIVGISTTHSSPFQLRRSIRQGYPLAPFFYLFIVDSGCKKARMILVLLCIIFTHDLLGSTLNLDLFFLNMKNMSNVYIFRRSYLRKEKHRKTF